MVKSATCLLERKRNGWECYTLLSLPVSVNTEVGIPPTSDVTELFRGRTFLQRRSFHGTILINSTILHGGDEGLPASIVRSWSGRQNDSKYLKGIYRKWSAHKTTCRENKAQECLLQVWGVLLTFRDSGIARTTENHHQWSQMLAADD